MTHLGRRLTNGMARGLRAIKRRLLPHVAARDHAFARAYLRWVYRAGRLDVVDGVNGHRMYLDDRDSLRLSVNRECEPAETALFRREVKPGDVVLDLGANIGYFTLLFAQRVGPSGAVVAFEPDPDNFALLKRNLAANGYRNVRAERRAVWDATGPLRLFRSEENRGDHRSYESPEARPAITIDAVSIDAFLGQDLPRVDFVKMDIQGAEHHALRGMRALLARSPRVTLLTEVWPRGLRLAGGSAEEYVASLRELGFALYELREDGSTVPADLARLLSEQTPENDGFVNLLCRKGGAAPLPAH